MTSLRDLGRFSEPAFFILVSLADRPKHGYAIMEDVAAVADIRLGPGTLYGAIARLEARGLIEPLPSSDRRKPYRLTGAGVTVLEAQLSEMQHVARVGLGRLAAE